MEAAPDASEVAATFEGPLWVTAALFFGLGDLVTTSVGVGGGYAAEASPLAAHLIARYGLVSVVPLKVVAIGVCYGLWVLLPRPHDVAVPLALTTVGVAVTAWNAAVLLETVGT